MTQDSPITPLIKSVPVISSQDTLRRAAGLIRSTEGSRLPVRNSESIYGVITERDIAGAIAAADDVEAALDLPVAPLVYSNVTPVSSSATVRHAAGLFGASVEDALPVVHDDGSFCGMVYRRDVLGLLTKNLRPQTVAGMATPLGVYLTTGSVSGGAGSLGLFLTGVSLALMILVSTLLVDWLQRAFTHVTGINITRLLASPPLTYIPNAYDIPFYVTTLLTILVFFAMMRLLPLSGYHAAEHMTVHAIEAGDALTPEIVRNMPRVHPRCGTNLLAAAGMFIILTTRFNNSAAVLVALVVVVVGWRTIGGWLQYLVTTKRPSEKQLANGVAAGNELLRRFQEQPNLHLTGWRRIWRLGFLQTAAGMFTILWLADSVLKLRLM